MKKLHLLKLVTAMAIVLAVSVSANVYETEDRIAPDRAATVRSDRTGMASGTTDESIEALFNNSYVYKTHLQDDQIEINSRDGAVTLSGTAQSDTNKRMAENVAEALPGVKSVNNRIQLSDNQPSEHSDMWVQTKVKSSLLYHRNVPGLGTSIEVNDGIVTLTGEADNRAEKERVTEYVQDVVGVKEVNNQMTLAASPTEREQTWSESIDDASITAQAKGALMWNRSTSGLKTGVSTNDGVVTVSGEANTADEKALVARLVKDIHGVKRVVNDMTIAK